MLCGPPSEPMSRVPSLSDNSEEEEEEGYEFLYDRPAIAAPASTTSLPINVAGTPAGIEPGTPANTRVTGTVALAPASGRRYHWQPLACLACSGVSYIFGAFTVLGRSP